MDRVELLLALGVELELKWCLVVFLLWLQVAVLVLKV